MRRVLLVEDNVEVAQYIGDIFEISGYHVRIAYDGNEGWEEIQHHMPDVVVSDVNMPGMDGYELLNRIRHYNATETLPCILLTARAERENIRQGMTSGADDYITKPFSAKEIVESVEAVLQKQARLVQKQETTLKLLRKNISYALPHELRTPLQGILGYANLMQMDYNNMQGEQIKRMSGAILKSGNRLQRVLENALAYAQLEVIATDPQQQKQLRNNILPRPATVIEDTTVNIAAKHSRLGDLQLDLDERAIRISVENFQRIIEELVDNAFKFSKPGQPVTIRACVRDTQYIIDITDHGRGMSAEEVNRIGAYMQFDRVLYEQQGLGMGLTIAQRLVELHAGDFEIDSMPKQGTAIRIVFKS